MAYRQQPPFSTFDALNVVPSEVIRGRERGGSRPGLSKHTYTQLGSGNPIRLLDSVTVTANDKFTSWTDYFEGTALGGEWSTASWIGTSVGILPDDVASVDYDTAGGVVRSALTAIDTSSAYSIEIYVEPYEGAHQGKYQLFARMDNTTPVATTGGVIAELEVTGATGIYTGQLTVYASGVPTVYAFTGGTTGDARGGWFRMYINGNDITCYWLGTTVLAATTVSAAVGSRVGFGMEATVEGGITLVDTFRAQYYTTYEEQPVRRTYLIASANGSVYRDGFYGEMTALAGSVNLTSSFNLEAAERGQKLFVADFDLPRVAGTDGVRGTGNDKLDAASVSDWTAKSIDANNDVVVVTNVSGGGAVAGVYKISSVASGEVTLTTSWCTGVGATCYYSIQRAPKVIDPIANTIAILTATAGTAPTGCRLVCRYRDRIVWAGDPDNPHLWYMSRLGDGYDYDYGADPDDLGKAIAGSVAEAGRIGEPVLALIPHTDDYLIFGCTNSMWVLSGDPAYGGQINNLSQTIGCVSGKAWCRGPGGEVIFLSRDGIYMIQSGGSSYPVSISRERIPEELLNVDPDLYAVNLVYDPQMRGVHIYRTRSSTDTTDQWFFDWETKGFWRWQVPSTREPMRVLYYASDRAHQTGVLLGCRDGYIRRYEDRNDTDEGTEITSYVLLGPIGLSSNDYNEGVLQEILGVMALESGSVTWSVQTAYTAEESVDATALWTGTWTAGRNISQHPRARGMAMCLKLENAQNRRWAVESVTAKVVEGGKVRMS